MDGDPQSLEPQARYFAANGFDAYTVQYRTFRKFGTLITESIEDTVDAVNYILLWRKQSRQFGGVVLLGASAGGLLVLMASQQVKVDALVLFNPVTNVSENGFSNKVTHMMDSALLREISPIHTIKTVPPTIIFHGTADDVVPISASVEFMNALNAIGNNVTLKVYRGRGHGFFRFHIETLAVAEAFINKVFSKTSHN